MDYVSTTTEYQCDLCLASTNDRDNIMEHMEKYHKEQIFVLKKWKEDHKVVEE